MARGNGLNKHQITSAQTPELRGFPARFTLVFLALASLITVSAQSALAQDKPVTEPAAVVAPTVLPTPTTVPSKPAEASPADKTDKPAAAPQLSLEPAPLPTISKLAPIEDISLVPPKLLNDGLLSLGAKPEPIIIDADLWNRIRNGFAMESLDTPAVQEHEQWYAARPDYIKRFVERGSKYLHHIVEEVEKRGMPMEVALLPVIESAFNPQAYSRAKAAGMWQFIPSTGKNFGLQQDALNDHRRDVLASTTAALAYLQKLYGMFNAWDLAFAAYNCGEGCVGRAIAANQKRGLPTNFLALNLPKETKQYVPKLLAIRNIVLSPGSYGLVLDTVPDQPYFAKVAAPARIDLKLAAHLAELSLEDFKALNPSFNRPIASGSLGYFLLPQDRAETFRHNLAAYQATRAPLVSWATYTARAGENLDVIGKRYGMTGLALRFANPGLKERRGKLAQAATLQIPLGRETASIAAQIRQAPAPRPVVPQTNSISAPFIASAPIIAATPTPVAEPLTRPQIVPSQSVAINPPVQKVLPAPVFIESTPDTITVKPGDSIFSISKATGVLMADIKAFNNLTSNAIRVGQRLKLSSDSASAAPTQAATANAPIMRAAPASHTVRSGDTLSGIADQHRLPLDDLLRVNGFTMRTVLKLGAKVKLPS